MFASRAHPRRPHGGPPWLTPSPRRARARPSPARTITPWPAQRFRRHHKTTHGSISSVAAGAGAGSGPRSGRRSCTDARRRHVDEDTTSPGPAPGSPSGPALDIRHPGAGPCEDTGTPSISTVIVCTRGPPRRPPPRRRGAALSGVLRPGAGGAVGRTSATRGGLSGGSVRLPPEEPHAVLLAWNTHRWLPGSPEYLLDLLTRAGQSPQVAGQLRRARLDTTWRP